MGPSKIVGQMVPQQKAAIALVERFGFRREATLRAFVVDRSGRTRDLVVMTCEVSALFHPADPPR